MCDEDGWRAGAKAVDKDVVPLAPGRAHNLLTKLLQQEFLHVDLDLALDLHVVYMYVASTSRLDLDLHAVPVHVPVFASLDVFIYVVSTCTASKEDDCKTSRSLV